MGTLWQHSPLPRGGLEFNSGFAFSGEEESDATFLFSFEAWELEVRGQSSKKKKNLAQRRNHFPRLKNTLFTQMVAVRGLTPSR